MRKILSLFVSSLLILSGCSQSNSKGSALIQFETVQAGDQLAKIKTSMGDITIKLFPEQAPKAVENFVTHAKNGYYNGIIFHRVIKDFMIQGGDPKGNGTGGESIWKKAFEDEFTDQLYHFSGALSMANAGSNTNGSQFFIVEQSDGSLFQDTYFESLYKQLSITNSANKNFKHAENVQQKYQEVGGTPHLDQKHTVFGQVIEGMDIVHKIASVATNSNDKPVEDITIQEIEIIIVE